MAKELVIPEDQLPSKFLEAVLLLQKLRHHKKIWDEHYGGTNRQNLRRWEEKADEFLSQLQIEETPDTNDPGENISIQ